QGVEPVKLIEVDVVGAEPPEARLDGLDEMEARAAHVVRARSDAERPLRGDDDLIAAALDRLTQDLFGHAVGVDVGRVEHGQAPLEADTAERGAPGAAAGAPRLEEFVPAAEGAGAETEDRDLESRTAELSVFHVLVNTPGVRSVESQAEWTARSRNGE